MQLTYVKQLRSRFPLRYFLPWTRALARELAPKISVNCICPGEIQLEEKGPDETWSLPNDRIPMGRSAYVDDIFDGIYFFSTASEAGGAFIDSVILSDLGISPGASFSVFS